MVLGRRLSQGWDDVGGSSGAGLLRELAEEALNRYRGTTSKAFGAVGTVRVETSILEECDLQEEGLSAVTQGSYVRPCPPLLLTEGPYPACPDVHLRWSRVKLSLHFPQYASASSYSSLGTKIFMKDLQKSCYSL